MTVGIIGLGLIGGSLAKAYKHSGQARVLGYDLDVSTKELALMSGVLDGYLTRETMSSCDLILIAVHPRAGIRFIREHADDFGEKPIVIDCGGIKRTVCETVFPIAAAHGFTFIGGHPMAGSHNSGFKYSKTDMFVGAPMVLVPADMNDLQLIETAKSLLSPAGFGRYSVTTAAEHDRMIAFTSQLAHVVSNAYIQSPTAGSHKGFSAGSYQDLTRVAWLDADMWTELFLENSDYLNAELDTIISCLQNFRSAIAQGDDDRLRDMLNYGKHRKEEVDGH
ncbi:MAG: prephenate dehydrogenase/arogenate dehydrogenase family protein [Clostridia bacterium]|nr:prephenate dehydrogenase/arogenate dehydrogenase family protein [Clostridia bacterium]